ncbi:uncharacterized protein LOC111882129 isoform X2 [Lactuca sativa]|uniref:uncharacterized protein LOC111882129 isoform X2 n=1 Tax=Lactuca sativa TaxID=4236 RepID=UPI001C68E730|nr:uncharacterized protein LOC111882129 isoform X2 [Lactuca sativa]
MNVAIIKKTKDLNRLSLAQIMAIIKACDLDDKQREINHINSYSFANLGIQSKYAFSSFTNPQVPPFVVPQSSFVTPQSSFVAQSSFTAPQPYPQVASSSKTNVPVPTQIHVSKENEENLALATGLVNCYNAFVAGELPPQSSFADLDQIHPEDVEEMDITWQITMAVFRAKQFSKKTGKSNWGMNAKKKIGFNKTKLRCFNCHEPDNFARKCLKPDIRENHERTMVSVGNNRQATTSNQTANLVVVAQSFDWDDQIQALDISGPENAHLAQINDITKGEVEIDPEEEMMNLQFAFMVQNTPELENFEIRQ